MKKLVWTVLVTTASAAAAALAIRGLRSVWLRIMHEDPPNPPWWARKLVGGPLGRSVKGGIEPTSLH
jgi:hypothetical protein